MSKALILAWRRGETLETDRVVAGGNRAILDFDIRAAIDSDAIARSTAPVDVLICGIDMGDQERQSADDDSCKEIA